MNAVKNAVKKTSGSFFKLLLPLCCYRGLKVVFAYHHVFERPPKYTYDPAMYILAETLEIHLLQMSKFFEVVPLETLLKRRNEPRNLCAITFDDGFHDVYHSALPVLKKYAFPATVFLTVSAVDRNLRFWFDDLFILADLAKTHSSEGPFIEYWNNIIPSWRPSDASAEETCRLVYSLKALAGNVQDRMVADGFKRLGFERPSGRAALDWSQIKEMGQNQFSFGSHGLDHVLLTQIDSKEKRRNVSESLKILRRKDIPLSTVFSYPNGNWDTELIAFLKQAGYTAGVTTHQGCASNDHIFTIPRLGLHDCRSNTPQLFWFAVLQAVLSR